MSHVSRFFKFVALFAVLCLPIGSVSFAQTAAVTNNVNYAKPPSWVKAAPQSKTTASKSSMAYQFEYFDTQVKAEAKGTETYSGYRVKILKPEALAIGNITLTWQPHGGTVTVHSLKIIRDNLTIDVLEKNKFRVIEREENLDKASLDGLLTAVLQVPSLRVGDVLEFSATVTSRDQTLGDFPFGIGQLPSLSSDGVFRYRLIWPAKENLHWQISKDLEQPTVHTENGISEVNIELHNPETSSFIDGAPSRYNIRRLIEYTGFETWDNLSRHMYPLYQKAATLESNSPVRAEIDRIKAASSDPRVQLQLALSLVEEQIRYVYVGLDGGNYRPATADETWERRYGDCKSKTVLLLAILKELGIKAEPVLVNTSGGDGINEWLANPILFDHVLVRAQIASETFWLDGTRFGDNSLDQLPPLKFRWVLPLTPEGSTIEKLEPQALTAPKQIENFDIDASAGFDVPAKVTFQLMLHSDEGIVLGKQLEGMSEQDATQSLKSYANNGGAWKTVDTVDWHYDKDKNVLILTIKGTRRLDVEKMDDGGQLYYLPGAGFFPPDERRRPTEQDQSAPWLITDFQNFKCWTTTVRLPVSRKGWHWDYEADPMKLNVEGSVYWRQSGLKDNVVRTVMSRNVYLPEITAVEAEAVNFMIPDFNDNMSNVFEVKGRKQPQGEGLPFGDRASWDELSKSCNSKGR